MIKTRLELPTEMYISECQNSEFKIKPVSDKCREQLETILDEGGKVKLLPEKNPTSIFASFNAESMPVDSYNHKVVGIEMNLHLHLIGYHRTFEDRLDKFIKDIKVYKNDYTDLPKNSKDKNVKYVHVINTYKY